MRQKVALAGALVPAPKLIILAEPLTGLEYTTRQVADERDLQRQRLDTCREALKLGKCGFEQRGVEGVRDVEPAGHEARSFEPDDGRVHGTHRA